MLQALGSSSFLLDVLVAAQADIGRLHVARVQINLRAQIAQVLEAFEQGKVAHIDLAGDSAAALGDPDRVRQILRNFVSNALRYGGDAVHIRVSGDDSVSKVRAPFLV